MMKNKVAALLTAGVVGFTSLFGAVVPTMAANKSASFDYKQVAKDTAFYRGIARKAISDDIKKGVGFLPDEIDIGVVVDEDGCTIFMPDCNGDVSFGKCHADYVHRGDVVAYSMQLDGNGECERVWYYVLDTGFYTKTDDLLHLYFAQGGDLH